MQVSPELCGFNKAQNMETVSDFIFLGSKFNVDGDCSHKIQRYLLLGRKAMTNLDSVLKSRDIIWPTKVHTVKVTVFPSNHVWMWELDHKEGSKVKVKVTQSCPTLCDPMNSTVHGILQARILKWVAFPFSRGSFHPRDQIQVSLIGC